MEEATLVVRWDRVFKVIGKRRLPRAKIRPHRFCSEYVRIYQDQTPDLPLPPSRRPLALLLVKSGRGEGIPVTFLEDGTTEYYPFIIGMRADGAVFRMRAHKLIVDTREKGCGLITEVVALKKKPDLSKLVQRNLTQAVKATPAFCWSAAAIYGLLSIVTSVAAAAAQLM